jgi:DNA ligase-1
VRRHNPDVEEWRKIRYMVFDLPAESESFNHRLAKLRSIVGECASPYLALVGQVRVGSRVELQQRLRMVVNAGGEGLMLHKGSSSLSFRSFRRSPKAQALSRCRSACHWVHSGEGQV